MKEKLIDMRLYKSLIKGELRNKIIEKLIDES